MVSAGIGVPIMAALNSGLGARLDNPVQAAAMLFSLALLVSLAVLLIQPRPIVLDLASIPSRFLMGGLFVAFYVLSVTFIAPKIGVGNSVVLVLFGQMVASAVIDHHGWLSAPQAPLSAKRVMGLAFVLTGVILMKRPIAEA